MTVAVCLNQLCGYRMAQNVGSRKLGRIAASEHFGGQHICKLAALHSKIARIKVLADKTLADWS